MHITIWFHYKFFSLYSIYLSDILPPLLLRNTYIICCRCNRPISKQISTSVNSLETPPTTPDSSPSQTSAESWKRPSLTTPKLPRMLRKLFSSASHSSSLSSQAKHAKNAKMKSVRLSMEKTFYHLFRSLALRGTVKFLRCTLQSTERVYERTARQVELNRKTNKVRKMRKRTGPRNNDSG